MMWLVVADGQTAKYQIEKGGFKMEFDLKVGQPGAPPLTVCRSWMS